MLGLITFICATVFDPFVTYWGGGWVQFVGITAFLLCVLLWFMYFFYIMDKIPATVPMTLIVSSLSLSFSTRATSTHMCPPPSKYIWMFLAPLPFGSNTG